MKAWFALALVACHPVAPPTALSNDVAVGAMPREVLGSAAALRPVITRDDTSYLLDTFLGFDNDGSLPIAHPDCWDDRGEVQTACPRAVPFTDRASPLFPDLPATVHVIGRDGPCIATVGAPLLLSTSGCEPSMSIVVPITGCGTDLAPFASTAAFDPELRWLPTDSSVSSALTHAREVRDPLLARRVEAWLAEAEFAPAGRHEMRLVSAQVDAGTEALIGAEFAALMGTAADQCEWSIERRELVGLRHGDTLTPLDGVATRWDGAIAWRGRIAGVVSGDPTSVTLVAVHDDATVEPLYDKAIWSDNGECLMRDWAGVSYPCGL